MANSLQDALQKCQGQEEVFIIGGAQIFNESLPLASHLYTTLIHHAFEGDTHFPEINSVEWDLESDEPHPADEKNSWSYSFINYRKKD